MPSFTYFLFSYLFIYLLLLTFGSYLSLHTLSHSFCLIYRANICTIILLKGTWLDNRHWFLSCNMYSTQVLKPNILNYKMVEYGVHIKILLLLLLLLNQAVYFQNQSVILMSFQTFHEERTKWLQIQTARFCSFLVVSWALP